MGIQPVILCGGSGTRLWPLSRQSFPKQFVPLIGGKSLLQLTLERVAGFASGGAGVICVGSEEHRFMISEAMEAADIESIKEPMLKSFRQFADEQGEDRLALAALTRARDGEFTREQLSTVEVPTLVIAGAYDELAGNAENLAKAFPDGRAVTIPGCDHFSAIPHVLYKATVFDFLDGTLP